MIGKKKPTPENQEEQLRKIRLPRRKELEQFGIVSQRVGAGQIKIMCEDGIERNCRIPGKMKKRAWMRDRDLVIVRLWDFQPSKADVVWRYIGFQVEHLKRKGYLDNMPI